MTNIMTMDELIVSVHYDKTGDWRSMPETEPPDDADTTSLKFIKLVTDDKAADHNPSPSPAQIDAGNYKKGHLLINGLDISIENSAGTKRKPEWPTLSHHYGYIRGTTGADGDQVDCFIRNQISEDYDGLVFIINQINPADGTFDEHKCMIGWPTEWEARAAYLENYSKGWNGIGSVDKFSFDEFKSWVKAM